MKVCGFCGTKLNDNSEDTAHCPECDDNMIVAIVEDIETEDIDEHSSGISFFQGLDFKTQRDYIMTSNGTDSEKLKKLNEYIDIHTNIDNTEFYRRIKDSRKNENLLAFLENLDLVSQEEVINLILRSVNLK